MINYAYESLFYQDSRDKQLNITFAGGSLSNSNIRTGEFELEEVLNSNDELVFGECNANKCSFIVGKYPESIAGKAMAVSITPSGATPFQLGVYKVLSDNPTADKRWREVVAYDGLYDILKFNCKYWYDSILPDSNTSVTLKQFRDSFFTYFGIIQETVNLPNDSMTITRTIEPSIITGKTILNKMCEINGCFGKIGRNGKFKYIFLEEATSGLFPSTTLYPSTSLYPQKQGFVREEKYTYYDLDYQEYEVQSIDSLQVLDAQGNVQVTVGNGTNVYIVKDNFLLFGKSDADVTSIATNMFSKVSGRIYRPTKIETIGNPCLEVGDGINLETTRGVTISTYILERKLKGIQHLQDNYIADGFEARANDRNGVSDQIVQIKDNIRKVEADYVKTETLEANYITADEIEADYVKTETLEADYLTASEIQADYATITSLQAVDGKFNNLNADNITSGTLNADRIDANSITVNKLKVNTLMADTILDSTDETSTEIKLHDLYFRGYYLTLQSVTIGGRTYLMLGFDTSPTP